MKIAYKIGYELLDRISKSYVKKYDKKYKLVFQFKNVVYNHSSYNIKYLTDLL